ncbi:hypothetical protein EMIHUDRAFT_251725 [Emiliania huxleyi CCMP1516]|uniref:Uncharacterized protein n=2 Tax=Emiliania huxleyi TaxID=2903 RepID=A0A0D3KSE4_EMIH1|nr:hypothetical protein EMIHUDRAFT_251725 [Emiliania huxleyi CCMP1516]EOD38679.1 hypothetical protein EMIHUDRAFT_251725 [Emiliania huxleyi CCMP1516]|eukprot:XP_005791108.1 hypothetical protein EMIHUDRAFT_251725 [Emiliania huxleyi CCMP1516]
MLEPLRKDSDDGGVYCVQFCRLDLPAVVDRVCSSKVHTLELHSVGLTHAALQTLANSLSRCPSLTTLDLGGNPLVGDDGARAIADALRPACAVTTLALDGGRIGDAGGTSLARLLGAPARPQQMLSAFNSQLAPHTLLLYQLHHERVAAVGSTRQQLAALAVATLHSHLCSCCT